MWLLLKVTHGIPRGPYYLSLVGLLHTGDDLQQGGFTGTVKTDDADLRPVKKGEINILEYDFIIVRKGLPDPAH